MCGVMIQIVQMCDGNDLDNGKCVVVMIQIVKMCGDNDLDNENVWW